MSRDDAYVLDMLLAAREALDFATTVDFDAFSGNRMAQLAILKAIEIVGEAASRVAPEFAAAHPDIPWRAIVGMRNRLVHDYAGIDLERVWETVQRDIPSLIPLLEPLVPPDTD